MVSGTVLGRRRRAFVVVGLLVAVVGPLVAVRACGVTDARVNQVWVLEGGTTLDVIVDTCNARLSVDVDESPERIAIVMSRDDLDLFGSDDCADIVRVQLAEPVGTRTIVTRDGRAVPIATVPATGVGIEITDIPDAPP